MNFTTSTLKKSPLIAASVTMAALLGASSVLATDVPMDADAAQALARKSNCFKCHAIDKAKDAPSFKEIAAKNKGKNEIEASLVTYLKTGAKVQIDGKQEDHDPVKAKTDAETLNLVRYILSR